MSGLRIALLVPLLQVLGSAVASSGDRSLYHVRCLEKCYASKCYNDGSFKVEPPFALQLLQWGCRDDCSYECMWKTVEKFVANGNRVPQFHGKWPFLRIFGIQEPASVLFSLLNLYVHLTMYWKFKKTATRNTPMFYVWTYFAIVCSCGWFWSSVFHARDTQFTEVMDYTFAFTIVLTLLYCLLIRQATGFKFNFRNPIRIVYNHSNNVRASAVITCGYLSILYTHISHLWSGRINYDYNMTFNIAVGFITFLLTMYWWYQNSTELPHSHHIGWFTILSVVVTLLEVADFPPIFWVFDAHSLWHASTIPLVKYLYRFIIADCTYLKNYYLKLDDHIE